MIIAACLADRQPGEYFIVDANGGLIPETALRMLRLLPAGLDFVLEAPCATWRETLSLRRRCSVPIILDELVQQDEDLARMVALDAAGVPTYVEQLSESDLVQRLDEEYDVLDRLEEEATSALGGIAGPDTAVELEA